MTGSWSVEEGRGDMETMEQLIGSSLFSSYIWLSIFSSYSYSGDILCVGLQPTEICRRRACICARASSVLL